MLATFFTAILLSMGLALAETPAEIPVEAPIEAPAEKAPKELPESDEPESSPKKPKAERTPFDPERFSWAVINPQRHEWAGDPISLSLRDADLVEVLRSFAKMTDANVIIDSSVQGKVTVELKDVPWDQALYVILKSHGLGMEITGNVWNMLPSEKIHKD